MSAEKPETQLAVDGIKVHSLYVGTFPQEMLDQPHVTARRMHKEGFSDSFLNEALSKVQHPLFGGWGLIGEKGGNDVYADRCSVYIFGQYYGRDGLTLKTRGLMVLASLCVLLRDGVLPTWTNACLNLGWSEDQLKEIGALASHVGGFPISRGSLMILDDVFEKRRAITRQSPPELPPSFVGSQDELYRRGCEIALQLFGTPDGDFADLPLSSGDDLRKEMVTWVFGYLFVERNLVPLKEKILAVIAMSTAAARPSFLEKWVKAARSAGCTRLEVQETILTAGLYGGWPPARDALDVLAREWPLEN